MPPKAATRPRFSITTCVASCRISSASWLTKTIGTSACIAQPLEVGQDLRLPLLVERAHRFVEQQQPRLREQRTSQRDALAFTAREAAGTTIEQVSDIEHLCNARFLSGIACQAVHPATVIEILRDAQMRKQSRILKHVADAAPMRRDVDRALPS